MFILVVIVLVIALVVLERKIHRMEGRLDHVESYLASSTSGTSKNERPHVATEPVPAPELLAPAPTPMAPTHAPEPDVADRFIEWVKEDWLMKLGGLLVIIGMAWLVTIVFGHIGMRGQIAIGLAFGVLVLVLGRWRLARSVAQGSILMFVGAVVVMIALLAGREVFEFFTPHFVLITMFLTSVLLGITALKIRRPALAYANVLMGAFIPVPILGTLADATTLPTYLLVLAAGSVWVAIVTGWRGLILCALLVVTVYSPLVLFMNEGDLAFAFLAAGLFFATSIVSMRARPVANMVDIVTALWTGLFVFVWMMSAEPDWQTLMYVFWAVIFAVGAFAAVRLGASRFYYYAYCGAALLQIGAATALLLDGPALTIAFLIEAVTVLVVGYLVVKRARALVLLSVPLIIPIALSLPSVSSSAWRTSVFHNDALVLLLVTAAAIGLALFFARERARVSDEGEREGLGEAQHLSWVIAGCYGVAQVWLMSHALFSGDAGTMVALIIYTLAAVSFYMAGSASGTHWQRITAGVLIAGVVGRLLLVEAMDMEREARILTFLSIGVVFVIVAWLERDAVARKLEQRS